MEPLSLIRRRSVELTILKTRHVSFKSRFALTETQHYPIHVIIAAVRSIKTKRIYGEDIADAFGTHC